MARVQSKVSKKASSHPVIRSKAIASAELPVAPEKRVEYTNAGAVQVNSEIIIQGDVLGSKDKAATLAFFEELVTIELAESSDKNPERFVFLSVNGVGAGPNNIPWVPRGIPVTIKRKYYFAQLFKNRMDDV